MGRASMETGSGASSEVPAAQIAGAALNQQKRRRRFALPAHSIW